MARSSGDVQNDIMTRGSSTLSLKKPRISQFRYNTHNYGERIA